MISRRKGREFALQSLYALEVGQCDFENSSSKISLGLGSSPRDREYGLSLIRIIDENLPEINSAISKHAENWSMERMAVIDRILLRCSLAEMLFMDDIPVEVSISEAVQIAKKYSDSESSSFINGILDTISKSVKKTC